MMNGIMEFIRLITLFLTLKGAQCGWWSYQSTEFYINEEPQLLNFDSAREFCQSMDGDLATIDTPELHQYIVEKLEDLNPVVLPCKLSYYYWIGLVKPEGDTCELCRDGWSWLRGQEVTWENWMADEPHAGERKLYLHGCFNYTWVARPDSFDFKAQWICQRDPKPPTKVEISLSNTDDSDDATTVSCTIPSVLPGVSDTNFTIILDDMPRSVLEDSVVQGVNKDNSVWVRYEAVVSLDQSHVGSMLMCKANWRKNSAIYSPARTIEQVESTSTESSTTTTASAGDDPRRGPCSVTSRDDSTVAAGIITIFLGISIIVNVILGICLIRLKKRASSQSSSPEPHYTVPTSEKIAQPDYYTHLQVPDAVHNHDNLSSIYLTPSRSGSVPTQPAPPPPVPVSLPPPPPSPRVATMPQEPSSSLPSDSLQILKAE